MSSIDEEIRKALAEEDQQALAQIDDEAGLFEIVGMSFHGKQAWLTLYIWAMGFIAFLIGVYCFLQVRETSEVMDALMWTIGIIVCLFILAIIKVISWTHMQKLELMREIKRLEARVMLALADKR
ncbi:MAG: hypothetical protein ISP88_05455 [Pseudomonadales bacterium]|nr:hypothetical protein [Pseudomonadales bacterium]